MNIIETTQCKVDLAKVINIQGFSLERILEVAPDFLKVSWSSWGASRLQKTPDYTAKHCQHMSTKFHDG